MAKSNEPYTEEEQEPNRMRSIDIRGVNAPPKSAKVLADRGYGCESGSEDTTISIKAVRGSGLGMNQRATEECSQKDRFRDGTTRGERAEVADGRKNRRHKVSLLFPLMRYSFGCMNLAIRKMRLRAWQQSSVS